MIRLLAALAVLLCAGVAGAVDETCNFSTTGNWTAVGTFSGTDDCTLGATDTIVINSGAVVTITSGSTVTQSGTESGVGIVVESGGELVVQAGATLALGVDGLDCQAGSTCRTEGTYRQTGITSPGTTDALTTANRYEAGALEVCPSADCTAVTLSYAAADYEIGDGSIGETFIDEAIEAIADTDILCWWGFSSTSPRPPIDEGFCYEIDSAQGTVSPYTITFDIRQGDNNLASAYPLARRDALQTTLNAALALGSTVIELPTGAFGADDYYNGRMVRFEDGSGEERDVSYRIYDSVNGATTACDDGSGPCDLLYIVDPRGVASAQASGDDVWIDYGWAPGDTFYVIRPAVITSASTAELDSGVTLDGTVDFRGAFIDTVGSVAITDDAVISDFTDVWMRDVSDGLNALDIATNNSATFTRVRTSGDETTRSSSGTHAIVVADASESVGALTFNGLYLRHASDDFFSITGTGAARDQPLIITDYRAQFAAADGTSQGCLKGLAGVSGKYPADYSFRVTNAECIDAATDGDYLFAADADFTNAIAIANKASYQSQSNTGTGKLSNFLAVGNASGTNQQTLPLQAEGFVVRNHTGDGSGEFWDDDSNTTNPDLFLKNGYVIDSSAGTGPVADPIGLIENVGFIDLTYSGDFIQHKTTTPTANTMVYRRVLFATRSGGSHIRGDVVTSLDGVELEGVAFIDNTDAAGALDDRSTDDGMGLYMTDSCFFNNTVDVFDEVNTASDTLRAVPPRFVDSSNYRYDVPLGTAWAEQGCGIRSTPPAGVCRNNKTLAWSNLSTECMSDLRVGGSVGGRGFAAEPFGHP